MSVATAKAARAAMKEKAQRMAKKPARVKTKIDMGSMEAAEQGATTKAQKAYRTARKDGGKVHGKAAPKRADKVQRRIKKQDAGSVGDGGLIPRPGIFRSDDPNVRSGGPNPADVTRALQLGAGTSPMDMSGATGAPFRGFPPIRGTTRDLVQIQPPRTGAAVSRAAAQTAAQLANAAAQRESATDGSFIPSRPEARTEDRVDSDFVRSMPERRPAVSATAPARARPAASAARQPTADELMDYYNIKGGRVGNEMAQLAAMRNRPEDAGPMKRGGAAKKKSAKKTAKGR